jgi:cell division protein FtsB
MTGMEASAKPTSAGPRRPRVRMPATRRGLAWTIVLLIIGAFLAVQIGRQVYTNWEIGRRAEAIGAEIAAIEQQNEELRQELEYLQSDAYVGAEARRLANLGARGEEVLIIPPGAEEPLPEELSPSAEPIPVLEQWVALFFGSRPSD